MRKSLSFQVLSEPPTKARRGQPGAASVRGLSTTSRRDRRTSSMSSLVCTWRNTLSSMRRGRSTTSGSVDPGNDRASQRGPGRCSVVGVDSRNEIRDFLASRRARITPERAGLPAYGGNRRVTGLRREEVALLAGVSVDYYTRLERGNARGVSDGVLEALARALQLDEAERAHLFDLARAATTTARTRRRPAKQQVRPSVQRILDPSAPQIAV